MWSGVIISHTNQEHGRDLSFLFTNKTNVVDCLDCKLAAFVTCFDLCIGIAVAALLHTCCKLVEEMFSLSGDVLFGAASESSSSVLVGSLVLAVRLQQTTHKHNQHEDVNRLLKNQHWRTLFTKAQRLWVTTSQMMRRCHTLTRLISLEITEEVNSLWAVILAHDNKYELTLTFCLKHKKSNYLHCHLASEGIVTLGVILCMCVCVCRAVHATLVLTGKVMRCIQCSVVCACVCVCLPSCACYTSLAKFIFRQCSCTPEA